MDTVNGPSGLGEYVQFGKWTFQNITDRLQTVTDPEKIKKFEENSVRFERGFEEQKGLEQKYFSPYAMEASPVISGAAKEICGQGQAAIDKFFDGTMSAEELGDTLQSLSDRLLKACEEEVYPSPLFGGSMAAAREKGWEDKVSVPDYKAKGLNLYYNFNSALSNHFNVNDQFVVDADQVPPRDFRWFYQSGGNNGAPVLASLTITKPDGTETVIDYAGKGFSSTDPTKGTTWAAYKDENGTWQYDSADFIYDFSKDDLKNVSGLLKFAGRTGASWEAVNQFLRNLQVYPGSYFSRFPQYGERGLSLRA